MAFGESEMSFSTLSAIEHPELLVYRNEFPILQQKTYLNSCSLGAISQRSLQGMAQFMMGNEWERWLYEISQVKKRFATIIGAQPHEIAIAPSVSGALSSIASALDYRQRHKVIMSDLDFPTLPYQWLVKERLGVSCKFVESPDGIGIPAELFAKQVDQQTALVATSRVFYTSGYVQDIPLLADIAHQQGAYLLVDDYQGTGQLPINVKAMKCDFLVSGGLKWLMGGPGLAFVYIREELIPSLEPTMTGWFGHNHQFGFDVREFAFRQDAARIETGTPAMAAVYAANGGLEIALQAGIEQISERTRYLTDDLIARASAHGWNVRISEQPERRSAIVTLGMEQPQKIVQELAQRKIVIDSYPGVLRISPYFYNTVEENAAVVAAIAEIIEHDQQRN